MHNIPTGVLSCYDPCFSQQKYHEKDFYKYKYCVKDFINDIRLHYNSYRLAKKIPALPKDTKMTAEYLITNIHQFIHLQPDEIKDGTSKYVDAIPLNYNERDIQYVMNWINNGDTYKEAEEEEDGIDVDKYLGDDDVTDPTSKENLDTLEPKQYVSGDVINYFVSKIKPYCRNNFFIFSTYATAAMRYVNDRLPEARQLNIYKDIKRKFLVGEIKDYKYILFPMCFEEDFKHWILYLFDVSSGILQILDPLHAFGGNAAEDYGKYNQKIIKFLSACETPVRGRVMYYMDIPAQTDNWRCGYFLMMNMICIIQRNFNFEYTVAQLEQLRLALKAELTHKATTNRAYKIKKAILKAKSKRSKRKK